MACGGDDDDTPDARPPADAAADAGPADAEVKTYCYDDLDTNCGYEPESLLQSEISLTDQMALARRFNTADVYTNADVWAVSVEFFMDNAQPLMSAEHDGRLNFSYDVDTDTYQEVYPSGTDLEALDFKSLPTDNGEGRGLCYFLDLPGTVDATGYEGIQPWIDTWRSVQGYTDPATVDPTAAPYRPTQYAHLFWLSKEDNLLAIQYWYFHPFDKFQNNHEGDWEHTNVVLDYEDPANPFVAFAQFSAHGLEMGRLATDLYRVGDKTAGDGDHVVVFNGGDTCMTFDSDTWCGDTSGASFPYPGVFNQGFVETMAGTSERPGRPIHANDFDIVLLPRLEDVTAVEDPNLTWYGSPILFGEPITPMNDPVMQALAQDRAPVGPDHTHPEFEAGIEQWAFAIMRDGAPEPFAVPESWTLINEPPAEVFE